MGKVKAESFKFKWSSRYCPSAFGTWHSCILAMPYPRRYFIILRCSTFYDFNAAEVFLLVPKAWGGKAAWASFKVYYYSNYLPPVSTTTAVQAAKFAAGVIDTVGAHWLANLSADFWKNLKRPLVLFSGAWGKMIHEKTWSKKSRDTVPLTHLECRRIRLLDSEKS
jgi:hypothetical protein